MRVKFLPSFLSFVASNGVKLTVLRDYSGLPHSVGNDLDVYISPHDLKIFLKILENSTRFSYEVSQTRLGLIKGILSDGGESFKLDIRYEFSYIGLRYLNMKKFEESLVYNQDFLVYLPDQRNQMLISILKELLHNGSARADKKDYLLSSLDSCFNCTNKVFLPEDLERFQAGLRANSLEFGRMRKQVIYRLVILNLKRYGVVSSFMNCVRFAVSRNRFKYVIIHN